MANIPCRLVRYFSSERLYQPSAERGFTLIEILLVLVVMALMAGLLVSSVSDNPAQQLDREAKRFQLVMEMAADEALTQGLELSLQWLSSVEDGEQGYHFLQWDYENKKWLPREDDPYGFHPVSELISIKLELKNTTKASIGLFQNNASLQGSGQPSQLLILSSGEITPFTLILIHDQFPEPVVLSTDGINGVDRQ